MAPTSMKRPDAQVHLLYSAAEIADRIESLAGAIARDWAGELQIIAILKGSFVFAADLIRALHGCGLQPRIDFITLASYGTGTQSSGVVSAMSALADDVEGRRILLVDDILETGNTLAAAKRILGERGAAEVRVCVLLDKSAHRQAALAADYAGFACPDRFVVGYGLDYAHYYRELPYIGYVAQS